MIRLSWPRPNVVVIDEELGLSAASAAGRAGFQRHVAEVRLGHIRPVLGFEVSRLARPCRNWYQLLEICALAGTGDGWQASTSPSSRTTAHPSKPPLIG